MTNAHPASFRPKHTKRQRSVCSGEICTVYKAFAIADSSTMHAPVGMTAGRFVIVYKVCLERSRKELEESE